MVGAKETGAGLVGGSVGKGVATVVGAIVVGAKVVGARVVGSMVVGSNDEGRSVIDRFGAVGSRVGELVVSLGATVVGLTVVGVKVVKKVD